MLINKFLTRYRPAKDASRNNAEDSLWIRKYFIVFSSIFRPSNDIRGRKLNIFISKAIHIVTLDLLLIANMSLSHKNILKYSIGVKIIFTEESFLFLILKINTLFCHNKMPDKKGYFDRIDYV